MDTPNEKTPPSQRYRVKLHLRIAILRSRKLIGNGAPNNPHRNGETIKIHNPTAANDMKNDENSVIFTSAFLGRRNVRSLHLAILGDGANDPWSTLTLD